MKTARALGLSLAIAVGFGGCAAEVAEFEGDDVEFTEEFWQDQAGKTDGALERRGTLSASADQMPWGGYFWSMREGALVTGWHSGERTTFTSEQIRAFDACIASYESDCVNLIHEMAGENGARLSPMMKFDLYVRRRLARLRGEGGAPYTAFSHAAKWELENHYIGDNTEHPHYRSAGYAGKCIGWALATADWNEPTKAVELEGVTFQPADIKGYLASIYNGAQFFVPNDNFIGLTYRDVEGENTPEAYNDVHPHDFVTSLLDTIGEGSILEADLDPGDGVWNYPIYKFDLEWERKTQTRVSMSVTIYYVNDEVGMDEVFSTEEYRRDVLTRTLTFDVSVARNWNGNLRALRAGRNTKWTGSSLGTHPDSLITGLEEGWRTSIYDYRNSQMNKEVNFQLIKREGSGRNMRVVIDELLANYYAE